VRASVSGDWTFFFTDVEGDPSSMTYRLEDSLLSDCDLYINGWGSESSITIDHPRNGVWVAGVYNFFSCSFTLSLTIEEAGKFTFTRY
jgi:hypothetical protein